MSIHDLNLDMNWLLNSFAPISLEELNATAEMMSRIDNKYVVSKSALKELIPALAGEFRMLEIDDRRLFTYDTRYFDDVEYSSYYQHHKGQRKRCKVRKRSYVDAGINFLEVKVKAARGRTEKFRRVADAEMNDQVNEIDMSFIQEIYANQYSKPFEGKLKPVLDMNYKRITLVAKNGGERMTIDTDLTFQSKDAVSSIGTDFFIVEAKSALGRGVSDKILRAGGQRPTKKCSKYCIGMAATDKVSRRNEFLPAMCRLGLVHRNKMGMAMPNNNLQQTLQTEKCIA